MPKTRFSWILLILGTLMLGGAWIIESREPAKNATAETGNLEAAPVAGYLAPDISLPTLTGETFTLSEYRGQPVVLNFWATWCPPCRAEIPHFQAASRTYNGQVAIIGVNSGEQMPTVTPFVREFGMTYPVPVDADNTVGRDYRVTSLPTTIFIDSRGVVQGVHIGIINQAVLESRIQALLDT